MSRFIDDIRQTVKVIPLETRTPGQLFRKYLRKKAWNWFDWNQNIFLKPNDGISHLPLMGEQHDEDVVQALVYLARFLPDTFLDVGANIGLVAVALAKHVRQVVCIEANPLVCNILKVNLALNCNNFSIHEYALGTAESTATLHVPRSNLGGAFLLDSNQYDLDQLARKDGYTRYDSANYLTQTVTIRACDDAMRSIKAGGPTSLLVKIDVEGLDQLVLESLLKVFEPLLQSASIAMVFESHDQASAKWLHEKTKQWGYSVHGLRIKSLPQIRQPLIRRICKLFAGEQHELSFTPLDELTPNSGITNFACCPSKFLN